jgi:hypothetical protein
VCGLFRPATKAAAWEYLLTPIALVTLAHPFEEAIHGPVSQDAGLFLLDGGGSLKSTNWVGS